MIDKRFTVAQEVTLWLLQKTRIDIDQEYLIFLMMDRSGRQKKNMAQRLARPFLAESSHQAAVNARNKKKGRHQATSRKPIQGSWNLAPPGRTRTTDLVIDSHPRNLSPSQKA